MENQNNNNPTTAVTQMDSFNAMSMYFDGNQFATAQRVCLMLASSDLVPKEYQYKPMNICNPDGTVNPMLKAQDDANKNKAMANCMIALNKAAQLHSDPLTIMQNMAIVYGRPSWSATFLIGTVNTCGRFMPLKFRFAEDGHLKETYTVYTKSEKGNGSVQKTIDCPNYTCVAYTTERGSEEVLEGTLISMRMAFEERWIQKDGSKWLTMPKQMLMYRAAAFWVRVYAPEISQGMRTTEEERDIVDVPYEDVTDKVRSEVENTPVLTAPTIADAKPAALPPAQPGQPAAPAAEPKPATEPAEGQPAGQQPMAAAPGGMPANTNFDNAGGRRRPTF